MDSYMAGPICMKLSGIEKGNSVDILGQKKFQKVARSRSVNNRCLF